LFPGNVDHVRNPADNFQPVAAPRKQIIWSENSVAEFVPIRFGKIIIAHSCATPRNLTRVRLWIDNRKTDAFQRRADEAILKYVFTAIVANPAAFPRTKKKMERLFKYTRKIFVTS